MANINKPHLKIEVLFIILVVLFGLSAILDSFADIYSISSNLHIYIEFLVSICSLTGLTIIGFQAMSLKKQNNILRSDLKRVSIDAEIWKNESQKFTSGLSKAIDSQLIRWGLTDAESDISRLLLKGLSLKEIADVRGTTERTVRQQTLAIYAKSGLTGRAELSAFFLEDLLSPSI